MRKQKGSRNRFPAKKVPGAVVPGTVVLPVSNQMYLRFVEGADSQDGRWLTGVVTAARMLKDDGSLDTYQVEIVDATFAWLNDHIPCPPFQQNIESGKWSRDAVAWFLPDATEAIQHMWELVAVLKDHGVSVRVLRTYSPGMIVYRDEIQIVAETSKRDKL